jgi:hypothetical protein
MIAIVAVAAGCSNTAGGTGGGADLTAASDDLAPAPTDMASSSSGDMAGCKKPTTLHPPSGSMTIYCPFSGTMNVSCTKLTQHCCEPSTGNSMCVAIATPCTAGNTDWQCQDPTDCTPGQVCCGTGTLVKSADPNCANFATGFHGTHCAASCTSAEIEMCTADAECSNGKTCVPFGTKGAQVGGCQ